MGKKWNHGKKGRWLPLQAAATATSSSRSTKSTHTQQHHKGINFSGDKTSHSNTQSIIIDIIWQWRQSEPKQLNEEPVPGSSITIIKEAQKLNESWLTQNQVKMKWRNMSAQDKKQIDSGLPPLPPSNQQPPAATLPPRPAGRSIGTTNQAKRCTVENNIQIKNTITAMYLETK